MTEKISLTLEQVNDLAFDAARKIRAPEHRPARVYAIPRGGIPAALAMRAHQHFNFVGTPAEADYIVDDLIDSGQTMDRVLRQSMRLKRLLPFQDATTEVSAIPVVLLDKGTEQWAGKWVVFPWEGDAVGSLEDNVRRMLQFIGEDATRGGLLETPARVAKAWAFWSKGYSENPADILKVFEDGAEGCDEMVMVRDIPFYTHCEHHMAPFFGTATIAYIPSGKIVGLSKLSRVVDCFARRLQVQERLTSQIADALVDNLAPKGVGVIVRARHLCMESRGVCQQGHSTVTSALRGVMLEGVPRQEFLHLAK